jgi:NDP-4-keto-2,6-dideoxyhexose 3-C-methyltransferase
MRVFNPKYLLVLIWSFSSEIIKQELNYIKKGGNLIFPFTEISYCNIKNYKKFINKNFKKLSYTY